jgi:coniferyl-aldehyde dehydrogenase
LTSKAEVQALHARLTAAFSLDAVPPVPERRARLRGLGAALADARDDLIAAADADFGPRAEIETLSSELGFLQAGLKHTLRHLSAWAAPRRRRVLAPVPGRTEIWREPKGVVGILSPWNYPLQLALMPLISAVAAGNRVILKPSERSPACAEALASLLPTVFDADEVGIVTGGPDVAQAVARLPLGHLFFTGSTATGRLVARAAAETLTPVTLELGGRSPAVALPDAVPADHAALIAWGAFFNAGQTCVAVNHLWVPASAEGAWVDAIAAALDRWPADDRTAPIDTAAAERVAGMLAEAEAGGARLRPVGDGDPPPTIVTGAPAGAALLREEVFGPALPIRSYADPEEVLAAEAAATPLSAYVFGEDTARATAFLARLRSGGGGVNAPILHLAAHDLPFGGIGESGHGAYHGERGFREFSHERAVLVARRGPWLRALAPPYGRAARAVIRRSAR